MRPGEIVAIVDALSEGATDCAKYLALARRVHELNGSYAAVEAWLGDAYGTVDELVTRFANASVSSALDRHYAEARERARERTANDGANADPDASKYRVPEDPPDALLRHGRMVDRSKPPPPLVHVIEGLDLAPGKVSAIQALANVAKTPLALLMTICVAAGKPFLGFEVQQRNALFLAFEGGTLTEEREARLCAGLGVDRASVPLHFMHVDASIADKDFRDDLEAYMRKHENRLRSARHLRELSTWRH